MLQTQSQKLILSPQIRQYLRLLELPLAQLETAIEQELAENPLLEETSSDPLDDTDTASSSGDSPSEDERKTEELRFDETLKALDRIDEELGDEIYHREDFSLPETRELERKKSYQESLITPPESLFDYLGWQVEFLNLTAAQQKISEEIIGSLSEDGLLTVPLQELADRLGVLLSEVEKVLKEIQSLDPPGIAARNLQETLLLQLERNHPDTPLAKRIVQEALPHMIKKKWDQIAKDLKVNLEEVHRAARTIAHLDPKPGRTFYGENSMAVKPDATVSYEETDGDSKLRVDIYDDEVPEIRINSRYRRMLKDPHLDPNTRRFLREKLQSALDFMKALSQRRSTLRGITEELIKAQTEFFEKGFSHLKPLRLKDISERLGIHESTVSRALSGKYITTPQGTIPYKSFFSSKLDRAEGGEESQKSMMEKIRELVASEDPRRPLSDQTVTKHFQKEGIKIARRTVAKYRELLKILPSHLRRER